MFRVTRLFLFILVLFATVLLTDVASAQDATVEPTVEPTPTAVVVEAPAPSTGVDDTVGVNWVALVFGALGLFAGGFAGGVTTAVGFVRFLRQDDNRSDTAEKLFNSIPMTPQARAFIRGLFTDMVEVGEFGVEITDGVLTTGEVVQALDGGNGAAG